jgi:hypothetical protein
MTMISATATVVAAAACTLTNASLLKAWREAIVANQWTTAFKRTIGGTESYEVIIASVGGQERVAYRASLNDIEISVPVVSPDGTKVGFTKVERIQKRFRKSLYVANIDGTNLQSVAHLEQPPSSSPIKGAYVGTAPMSWAHDNERLLFYNRSSGQLPESPLTLTTP